MSEPRKSAPNASIADWRQRLNQPWLVAAWPGMGAVGHLAVADLVRQLGAASILELRTDTYFVPRAIEVQQGLVIPTARPRHLLFGWQDPGAGRDLVLLASEAQPEHDGHRLAEDVLALARDLGVERVCTFAAMASLLRPEATPQVFVAANEPALRDEAVRSGAVRLTDGSIGGLNGILVDVAARQGVPSLCLLGEMPFFATAIPNPKSAAAVLRVFGRIAGLRLDLARLDAEAATVEKGLVDHLRRVAEKTEKEAPSQLLAPSTQPESTAAPRPDPAESALRQRIEALFIAARQDRSKASELKAELDRLGRFRQYEDRFLDLFKRAE
jgi:uncharacterized protein